MSVKGLSQKLQIVTTLALILFSSYLTAYTVTVYKVASEHIIEFNGDLWWRTSPSGSLFPWPREPGMLQALSKVDEVDKFIYHHFIKSFSLLISSLTAWIVTGTLVLKSLWHLKWSSPASRSRG